MKASDYKFFTNRVRVSLWDLMHGSDVSAEDVPEVMKTFQKALNDLDTIDSMAETAEASEGSESKKK